MVNKKYCFQVVLFSEVAMSYLPAADQWYLQRHFYATCTS